VVATIGAALFLGEPVTLIEAVGIVLVIVAIAMVMRPRRHPLDENVLPA
jgi:drug/metabolite transporter (DMT)-like permease